MSKVSEHLLKLLLEGKREEAEKIAHQVVEMYREDPTIGPISEQPITDRCTCNCSCTHVFHDTDCQHEVLNMIVCDACFLHCFSIDIDD